MLKTISNKKLFDLGGDWNGKPICFFTKVIHTRYIYKLYKKWWKALIAQNISLREKLNNFISEQVIKLWYQRCIFPKLPDQISRTDAKFQVCSQTKNKSLFDTFNILYPLPYWYWCLRFVDHLNENNWVVIWWSVDGCVQN